MERWRGRLELDLDMMYLNLMWHDIGKRRKKLGLDLDVMVSV